MTTFYVNPDALSSGDGLSDLSPVMHDDELTIENGDSVLQKAGTTLTRDATVTYTGDYVTRGRYGAGDDPIIDCDDVGDAHGVRMVGQRNIIQDTEIINWNRTTPSGASAITMIGARYCTVERVHLHNGSGSALGTNSGTAQTGAQYPSNVFRDSIIEDNVGDGFDQGSTTSWAIVQNVFRNISEFAANITDGIAAHQSRNAFFYIADNVFDNIGNKSGIQVMDGDAIIKRNVFLNISGIAILVQRDSVTEPGNPSPRMVTNGKRQIIRDNLIHIVDPSVVGSGIVVGEGGNAHIEWNTIVNGATNKATSSIVAIDACTIRNNLLHTLGNGSHLAIGGRITSLVAPANINQNAYTSDGSTMFRLLDSIAGGVGEAVATFPGFLFEFDHASFVTLLSGLAETQSIVDTDIELAGAESFAEAADFEPSGGASVTGRRVHYGARNALWSSKSKAIQAALQEYRHLELRA